MRNGALLPAEAGELDDDLEWPLTVEELAELLRWDRATVRAFLSGEDD